ncbi:MAG: hypothetical protein HC849_29200, partial [Oscillatoriales cyanobacterium RU_3_3]|nr:hypothetical protein [Oscillatoriales cyanobacterium RU_3_3]
ELGIDIMYCEGRSSAADLSIVPVAAFIDLTEKQRQGLATEVLTPAGSIDLLTTSQLIEIKH